MERENGKVITNSLYSLAQQTLTVSLLKIRALRSSPEVGNSFKMASIFLFQELVDRIKSCKGIEIIHLISALPHSGLRPDLLIILETFHPVKEMIIMFKFKISNFPSFLDCKSLFREVLERSLFTRISSCPARFK